MKKPNPLAAMLSRSRVTVIAAVASFPAVCFADTSGMNPLGEPSSIVLVAIAVGAAAIVARWHKH